MARRSLQASTTGLEKATVAFKLKGWTQDYLAGTISCTRQVIINFFARRSIDQQFFQAICTELSLEWQSIAEFATENIMPVETLSINALVDRMREAGRNEIAKKCGTMKVLDMSQPISLDNIYTRVNILEKVTGRKRIELSELLKEMSFENFERFTLGGIKEKHVLGQDVVKRHSKLIILGKPGSGKTTFLKHLALQCMNGSLYRDHIPIFITLKEFADGINHFNFFDYVLNCMSLLIVNNEHNNKQLILNEGRILFLLDGLDEVREADINKTLNQIQEFTNRFHNNVFFVTCRIAAREYQFEQFTEVEISNFSDAQVSDFSQKWFLGQGDIFKANSFLQKIRSQKNKSIRELARNPLLLTLLCLVFEDSARFPTSRSELYQEGLDVLLKKWDAKRNIEREQVSEKLTLKRKEDLLSHIAWITFKSGNYFFKERELRNIIIEYIDNLPNMGDDQERLRTQAREIIKLIESQHGLLVARAYKIYSFSHLTFHEYFVARTIINNCNPNKIEDEFLHLLANNVTDKRWREVTLLTVEMLSSTDHLMILMKHKIDELLKQDQPIQDFLNWLSHKSYSVSVPYIPAATRVIYFLAVLAFSYSLNLGLARDLAASLSVQLDLDLSLDLELELCLSRAVSVKKSFERNEFLALYRALSRAIDNAQSIEHLITIAISPNASSHQDITYQRMLPCLLQRVQDKKLDLHNALNLSQGLTKNLRELKALLHLTNTDVELQKIWWSEHGQNWIARLRTTMLETRDLGHEWQFSDEKKALLRHYYDSNKLLIDCLNSDCYVSRKVRSEIEGSLFLPTQPIQ